MREKSDINNLFRTRLEHMEMDVRDGFWESLEQDLKAASDPPVAKLPQQRHLSMWRWAVAASVLLLLGAASWWWLGVPSSELESPEVLSSTSALMAEVGESVAEPEESKGSEASQSVSSGVVAVSGRVVSSVGQTQAALHKGGEESPVSVHFSITIRQHYGSSQQSQGGGHYHAVRRRPYQAERIGWMEEGMSDESSTQTVTVEDCGALLRSRHWALKAAVGTSLSGSGYHAPLTAGLSVERRLTRHLSLEAGVQYNRLTEAEGNALHTLGIPVKLNVLLAQGSKWDLYAQVGGMAEKCIAGTSDNSFRAEPVQGSVLAGLGVRYRLTDRLALFAEPSVSHHFDSGASTHTLRTEQPVNVNLLCGLRMTY